MSTFLQAVTCPATEFPALACPSRNCRWFRFRRRQETAIKCCSTSPCFGRHRRAGASSSCRRGRLRFWLDSRRCLVSAGARSVGIRSATYPTYSHRSVLYLFCFYFHQRLWTGQPRSGTAGISVLLGSMSQMLHGRSFARKTFWNIMTPTRVNGTWSRRRRCSDGSARERAAPCAPSFAPWYSPSRFWFCWALLPQRKTSAAIRPARCQRRLHRRVRRRVYRRHPSATVSPRKAPCRPPCARMRAPPDVAPWIR